MDTPAGWYDDGSGRQRWWDGQQWTDQYADAVIAPGAPVAPFTAAPSAPYAATAPHDTTAPYSAAASVGPVKPHVLGIIALVVAALGFVFACIPGALIVGWVLLPIAFILSIVALFLKGKKWPAIIGLILSVVGTIVGFIVFFFVIATAASDVISKLPTALPTIEASADSGATQPADEAPADSSYVVTIDSATTVSDYAGNPALVVNYTFTNNSAKTVPFVVAVRAQAFQNGVELAPGIVTDGADMATAAADVKPGATATVQWAYSLADTSDVTVEVRELSPFDPPLLATKTFPVG